MGKSITGCAPWEEKGAARDLLHEEQQGGFVESISLVRRLNTDRSPHSALEKHIQKLPWSHVSPPQPPSQGRQQPLLPGAYQLHHGLSPGASRLLFIQGLPTDSPSDQYTSVAGYHSFRETIISSDRRPSSSQETLTPTINYLTAIKDSQPPPSPSTKNHPPLRHQYSCSTTRC